MRAHECERENVFEIHLKLLKFARVRIDSASEARRWRAGAQNILKDYVIEVHALLIHCLGKKRHKALKSVYTTTKRFSTEMYALSCVTSK